MMHLTRRPVLQTGFALLILAVALLALRPSAPARAVSGHRADARNEPPAEVRAILRDVDAGNIERSIRTLVGFGTRSTLSSQDDPVRGIGAARDWIFDQFQQSAKLSGGRMTVARQTFVQPAGDGLPTPTTVTNLVATLHGSQPESAARTYVVSGHYDSRCTNVLDATCDAPGADDDASGVAAVLEMARVMATRSPDATIVFMAVAGEEQGLFGSEFFAEQAKQQNMDIEGMFTNDIIGSSTADNGVRDPRTVRLFSEGVPTNETPQQAATRQSVGGENDGPSRQLARYVKEVADNDATGMHVRLIWRRDRFLRGGDQIPFLERGYPAARFTEPNENFAHQHQDVRVENGVQFGDLPQFVDFAYTARVARVNLAALASLALAPATPKRARIIAGQLTNDTELRWAANTEPDLAGYEVVWRETTDPLWTHTIPAGNVTDFTVRNLSKDNVQFGVRAVDRQGHRSPVAFPVPASS
jgi:peptidase M28-like protein